VLGFSVGGMLCDSRGSVPPEPLLVEAVPFTAGVMGVVMGRSTYGNNPPPYEPNVHSKSACEQELVNLDPLNVVCPGSQAILGGEVASMGSMRPAQCVIQ